jgi:hypothetical protein
MSTEIKRLEFQLEKARSGLAMRKEKPPGSKELKVQSTSDYSVRHRCSDCSGVNCGNVCFAFLPTTRSRAPRRGCESQRGNSRAGEACAASRRVPQSVATDRRNRALALGAEDPDYDRCAALQSFFFSCASLAAMKARISADMSSSFSHCSLYKVTGKRPIP